MDLDIKPWTSLTRRDLLITLFLTLFLWWVNSYDVWGFVEYEFFLLIACSYLIVDLVAVLLYNQEFRACGDEKEWPLPLEFGRYLTETTTAVLILMFWSVWVLFFEVEGEFFFDELELFLFILCLIQVFRIAGAVDHLVLKTPGKQDRSRKGSVPVRVAPPLPSPVKIVFNTGGLSSLPQEQGCLSTDKESDGQGGGS